MSEVTRLLQSIEEGNRQGADQLLPLVYEELRKLARTRLANEKPDQSLQPTELVHEAYLRLVGATEVDWSGRGHFFGAAAEAMRRILIERARRRRTRKHGGRQRQVQLNHDVATSTDDEKLLSLDQALQAFEASDPKKAELVKLRYFAGLTNGEASQALGISTATADRYWVFAKAWLQHEMA